MLILDSVSDVSVLLKSPMSARMHVYRVAENLHWIDVSWSSSRPSSSLFFISNLAVVQPNSVYV